MFVTATTTTIRLLLLLSGLVLENLLDDLLFLEQKGADDSVSDTSVAERSSVSARHCSLTLGDLLVLLGAKRGNSRESVSASSALGSVRALLHVVASETTARSLHDLGNIALGTVAVASHVGNTSVFNHDEINVYIICIFVVVNI